MAKSTAYRTNPATGQLVGVLSLHHPAKPGEPAAVVGAQSLPIADQLMFHRIGGPIDSTHLVFPWVTGTVASGSSVRDVIIQGGDQAEDTGDWINTVVECELPGDLDEYRTVVGFDAAAQKITVDPPFSAIPVQDTGFKRFYDCSNRSHLVIQIYDALKSTDPIEFQVILRGWDLNQNWIPFMDTIIKASPIVDGNEITDGYLPCYITNCLGAHGAQLRIKSAPNRTSLDCWMGVR